MELSKAKEILKSWLEYNKKNKNVLREADTIIAVQETILKTLEEYEKQLDLDYVDKNYISKDEIRKKIEILGYLQEDAIEENALEDSRILEYKIKILQELLGE